MSTPVESKETVESSLQEALHKKDFEQVEQLWLQLAQSQPDQLDVFLDLSDRISKAGAPSRASLLLQMLVPDLISRGAHSEAYTVLKQAAEHTPVDREVRGLLLDCIRHIYKNNPLLSKGLEVSGLDDSADLRKAVEVFDTFISVSTGAYVYHEAGWGVGKITEFDPEKSEVFIDFKTRKGHRMAFAAVGKMVKKLPPDHYRVFMEFDIDHLKNLARSNPAELVKKIVRDEGRILNLRQVKAILSDSVVASSAWSKFWSDGKAVLRRDSTVAMSSGNNPTIQIRREAVTYEQAMLRKFLSARTLFDRARLVQEHLQHHTDAKAPDFLASVVSHILSELGLPKTSLEDRVVLLLLYNDLQKALPEPGDFKTPSLPELLREAPNVVSLLENLPVEDYRRDCLGSIQETFPGNWPQIYHDLLLSRCSDLWDLAYRGLIAKQHTELIRQAFAEVSRLRDDKPENFAWFCRSGILGRISPDILHHSRVDLLESLLILLDKLGSERGSVDVGKEARTLASQVRQILFHEIGDLANKVYEEAGQERTRHILSLILHNRGLTEHQRISLESRGYVVFPKLDVEEKKPHEDEAAIYVTATGLHKQQEELQRLVQVELPAVAQEIGRAKAFGDLSENAEYSAALENQAHLARRAKDMQEDINRVKLIEPDIVRDDEVSIGTRVTLRNTQRGFLENFTILGPWDANFDKRIISYRTAVAQGLLGRKAGETVTIRLPEGDVTYEIMAITKAIT